MSNQTEQGSSQENGEKITIVVNNRPLQLQEAIVEPDQLRQFADAPDNYEVWKVVKSPDPEGQLPVDDIQVMGSIEVKSGDRFRVVPPGTFGSR